MMMLAGMFLKDVLGEQIPPAKIHRLAVAQSAHTPAMYQNTRPEGGAWALYVEGQEADFETLQMEETRTVVAWFPSEEVAEAAKAKLMDMLTLDLSFLATPTWGAIDNEKGGA